MAVVNSLKLETSSGMSLIWDKAAWLFKRAIFCLHRWCDFLKNCPIAGTTWWLHAWQILVTKYRNKDHGTRLILKPILVVVLKFYWLDNLYLRRKCNKKVAGWLPDRQHRLFCHQVFNSCKFFLQFFSADASHVHGWLHVRFLLCAGDTKFFLKSCTCSHSFKHSCNFLRQLYIYILLSQYN